MEIKLIKYPYKDYEIGEIIDLGEDKNRSMVSLGRAVWVEEEEKKKPTKKTTKTTTQVKEDTSESEDSPPARGADGRFTSKKETEESK